MDWCKWNSGCPIKGCSGPSCQVNLGIDASFQNRLAAKFWENRLGLTSSLWIHRHTAVPFVQHVNLWHNIHAKHTMHSIVFHLFANHIHFKKSDSFIARSLRYSTHLAYGPPYVAWMAFANCIHWALKASEWLFGCLRRQQTKCLQSKCGKRQKKHKVVLKFTSQT